MKQLNLYFIGAILIAIFLFLTFVHIWGILYTLLGYVFGLIIFIIIAIKSK